MYCQRWEPSCFTSVFSGEHLSETTKLWHLKMGRPLWHTIDPLVSHVFHNWWVVIFTKCQSWDSNKCNLGFISNENHTKPLQIGLSAVSVCNPKRSYSSEKGWTPETDFWISRMSFNNTYILLKEKSMSRSLLIYTYVWIYKNDRVWYNPLKINEMHGKLQMW